MIEIIATADWHTTHPGAIVGLLEVAGVDNRSASPVLDQRKRQIEARLRQDYAGYSRRDFIALPVIASYDKYYRRFDKTYHILLQLESIVLKGKNLPDVSPLVDASFISEMDTFILTAGHDVAKLDEPVIIDVSRLGDQITQMNGETRVIRAGDMVMRDHHNLCCSILYGQDNRSPITAGTRHVLYVAYVPPGVPVELVTAHLQQVEGNIRLFAPRAIVEQCRLLLA